ncbi:hypothetical protein Q3G72_010650 [Acer saccharum]|nr:hypothetical protein Q3G72_010650 [Acer saccharum]
MKRIEFKIPKRASTVSKIKNVNHVGSWFHQPCSGSLFTSCFIGVAVSYGLFCRRNVDADIETHTTNDDDSESYVSRIFRVSSFFKDRFDNSCGYAQPDCSLNRYGESGLLMDHKSLNLPIRSRRSGDRNLSDGSESNSPFMGSSNSPYVDIDNEFGDMDPTNLENRFDETDSFLPWNWRSRSERMEFGGNVGAIAASRSHLRPLLIDETQF